MYKFIRTKSIIFNFRFLFFCCVIVFASCRTPKNFGILSELPDSTRLILPFTKTPNVLVQPDDIIELKINGSNERTSQDFNLLGGGVAGPGGTSAIYIVDKNGDINLYKFGKVNIAGLTIDSVKNKLVGLLSSELVNLNLFVRFATFKFSVLGNVRTPGNFSSQNEKVTILDALGYAGDFGQYANKKTIRVFRDSCGYNEIGKVNLTQKSLLTSPYFFLKRNDVIIVDADLESKRSTERVAKVSSIIGITTGIVTLVFLFVKK